MPRHSSVSGRPSPQAPQHPPNPGLQPCGLEHAQREPESPGPSRLGSGTPQAPGCPPGRHCRNPSPDPPVCAESISMNRCTLLQGCSDPRGVNTGRRDPAPREVWSWSPGTFAPLFHNKDTTCPPWGRGSTGLRCATWSPELGETKLEPHVLPAPRWTCPPVPGRWGNQPEEAQTPAGVRAPFKAPRYQHRSGLATFWGALAPSRGSHVGHKALHADSHTHSFSRARASMQDHHSDTAAPLPTHRLASLSLAEPRRNLPRLGEPGTAGCGLSRLGHDARIPVQPLYQSQVFLGVRVRSRLSSLWHHLLCFGSVPVSLHSQPHLGRRGPRATLRPEVQGGGGKAGQEGGRQDGPTPISPRAQVWASDQPLPGGAASQRGARQLHKRGTWLGRRR